LHRLDRTSLRLAHLLDHLISAVRAQGREQEASALKQRAQRIIANSRK
jgi:hypothetical protein